MYLSITFLTLGLYKPQYSMQSFTIDRLYPENWYTKAHEHCLMVWGTLDDMIDVTTNTMVPPYIVDASIGQLVFAKNCLHTIIEKNFKISDDDIMHLSHIVGTIEERCTQLPSFIQADKIELLKNVVQKLKKKIELLLPMAHLIPNQ